MFFELIIVAIPFLVGLVLLGLKHDITDTEYLETLNERADNGR